MMSAPPIARRASSLGTGAFLTKNAPFLLPSVIGRTAGRSSTDSPGVRKTESVRRGVVFQVLVVDPDGSNCFSASALCPKSQMTPP